MIIPGLRYFNASLCLEIIIRIIMTVVFLQLENMTPFIRHIHPDEMWLYRNPRRDSYVSSEALWSIALGIPTILTLLTYLVRRDRHDLIQTFLAISLSLGINCILTDMVKLIVGRPRPDFFWRCFPDGEMNSEMQCTGDIEQVKEGRKSFPSGHSSISFSSLGVVSWWSMGKLRTWSDSRGSSWRLLTAILPLSAALAVALSRTCDYHHHWQDVLVGSFLGISISYMCYRQYFPPLDSSLCHRPYRKACRTSNGSSPLKESTETADTTQCTDDGSKEILKAGPQVKWI